MLKDIFYSKEIFEQINNKDVLMKLDTYIRELAAANKIHLEWPDNVPLVSATNNREFVLMRGISFRYFSDKFLPYSSLRSKTLYHSVGDFFLPWKRRGDAYKHIIVLQSVYSLLTSEFKTIIEVENDLYAFPVFSLLFRLKKELETKIPYKAYISQKGMTIIIPEVSVQISTKQDDLIDEIESVLLSVKELPNYTSINIFYRKGVTIDNLIGEIFEDDTFVDKITSYSYRILTDLFEGRDLSKRVVKSIEERLSDLVGFNEKVESKELLEMLMASNPNIDLYDFYYHSNFVSNTNGFLTRYNQSIPKTNPLILTNNHIYFYDELSEEIKCEQITNEMFG